MTGCRFSSVVGVVVTVDGNVKFVSDALVNGLFSDWDFAVTRVVLTLPVTDNVRIGNMVNRKASNNCKKAIIYAMTTTTSSATRYLTEFTVTSLDSALSRERRDMCRNLSAVSTLLVAVHTALLLVWSTSDFHAVVYGYLQLYDSTAIRRRIQVVTTACFTIRRAS